MKSRNAYYSFLRNLLLVVFCFLLLLSVGYLYYYPQVGFILQVFLVLLSFLLSKRPNFFAGKPANSYLCSWFLGISVVVSVVFFTGYSHHQMQLKKFLLGGKLYESHYLVDRNDYNGADIYDSNYNYEPAGNTSDFTVHFTHYSTLVFFLVAPILTGWLWAIAKKKR